MTTQMGEAPAKATASFNLSFPGGLINLPLAVYSGRCDGPAVKRSWFSKAGNPVGLQKYDQLTNEVIRTEDVVSMAVASTGERVVLSDEEVADATSLVKGQADVVAFVPLEAIGVTYRVDAENQLRPQKRKVGKQSMEDPAVGKALGLLCAAMAAEGVAALFKVALRGAARYAVLTPDMRMLTLAFTETVREARPVPDVTFTDAELAAGRALIAGVGTDTPDLEDTASVQVQAYVDAKAAGKAPVVSEAAPAAPVVDLMAALAASVDVAKAQAKRRPARKAS